MRRKCSPRQLEVSILSSKVSSNISSAFFFFSRKKRAVSFQAPVNSLHFRRLSTWPIARWMHTSKVLDFLHVGRITLTDCVCQTVWQTAETEAETHKVQRFDLNHHPLKRQAMDAWSKLDHTNCQPCDLLGNVSLWSSPPPHPIPFGNSSQRGSTSAVQRAGQDFRNSGTNLFHLEISFSFYCCRAESKPDPLSKRRSLLLYCQNFLFSKMHSLKRFKMIINIKDLCLLYSNCISPHSVSPRLFFQEHEEILSLVTIKGRTWRI